MRTVGDIYKTYQTPPWLQLHQLRVAAVGKFLSEAYSGDVDISLVVTGCLLHDIGAIVKFNFDDTRGLEGLCPPEEVLHWKDVQREFRAKYGEKEKPATDVILSELGMSGVQTLVNNTGFANMKAALARGDTEVLIAQYADMRVGPFGILSLAERLGDVRERYANKFFPDGRHDQIAEYLATALEIEKLLFESASIRPEDITDATIAPVIEELRAYPI
ncbi:MAG: HD domain-containing protein [Minisyncoccia bacterium]